MNTPSRQQQQQHAESGAPIPGARFTFEEETRLLLKTSADFCAIDLFNDGKLPKRPANSATSENPKRRPRWVPFVRGLYLYTTARILVYVCLQYMYDFDSYEYKSLLREISQLQPATAATTTNSNYSNTTTASRTTTSSPDNINTSSSSALQLLEQKIARDVGRLRLVGAPFTKFHFGVELVYLYLTWAVFVLYFRPQLYFRYMKPFDVSLLRAIVDWEREQLHCDRMVQREVNKFCTSNRTFVRSFRQLFANANATARHLSVADFKFGQLMANLSCTSEHLNRMALDGSLKPVNRSFVWIKQTSRWMGYFCLWLLVSLLILIVSLFVYVPQSQFLEMSGVETAPMDLLFIFETAILLAIGVTSLNLYLTVAAFNTLDQIRTVNQLNRLIAGCIRSNTHTFRQIQAFCVKGRHSVSSVSCLPGHSVSLMDTTMTSTAKAQTTGLATTSLTSKNHLEVGDDDDDNRATAHKIGQCYAEMNNNMLFVVMSYKIFVSQTRSVRNFGTFALLMTVELVLFGPVISLFSAQYLSTGMLYIVVGCCVSFVILGDISMAPRCYFYSRYLGTYRALHSLLAHTDEVRCAAASTVDLYDSHTLLILRKELSEPHLLLDQFATTLLGFHFSYTNFLKIHFWFGILGILGYYASGPNKGGVFVETIRFL